MSVLYSAIFNCIGCMFFNLQSTFYNLQYLGGVPEWLNGAVSKTVVPVMGTQGSNPCPSVY
jgi:hypothetical protein